MNDLSLRTYYKTVLAYSHSHRALIAIFWEQLRNTKLEWITLKSFQNTAFPGFRNVSFYDNEFPGR